MAIQVLFGNNWGGRMQDALIDHVVQKADICDVMAFTEVNHTPNMHDRDPVYSTNKSDYVAGNPGKIMVNQFAVLKQALTATHTGYFAAENTSTYHCAVSGARHRNVHYGDALFVASEKKVIEQGAVFILGSYEERPKGTPSPRVLQYTVLEEDGEKYLIAHFHGVWFKDKVTGSTKSDAPIRITQSANVLTTLEEIAVRHNLHKVVFGGDLNLDHNTQALRMLESGSIAGNLRYRNLISEYGITSTRTPLYRDYHTPGMSRYADYVFVSDGVHVENFQLVGAEISDHLHLQVRFR